MCAHTYPHTHSFSMGFKGDRVPTTCVLFPLLPREASETAGFLGQAALTHLCLLGRRITYPPNLKRLSRGNGKNGCLSVADETSEIKGDAMNRRRERGRQRWGWRGGSVHGTSSLLPLLGPSAQKPGLG